MRVLRDCSAESASLSIARFHSGQAVVVVEAVVSVAVPEAEELVPEALPEEEEVAPKGVIDFHSAGQLAASAAAEDSVAGSVVLTERFARMKAESRSAVDWVAGTAAAKARFEEVVVHSAGQSAATAPADDSGAGWVVAKARFLPKAAWSRPVARRADGKAFARPAVFPEWFVRAVGVPVFVPAADNCSLARRRLGESHQAVLWEDGQAAARADSRAHSA